MNTLLPILTICLPALSVGILAGWIAALETALSAMDSETRVRLRKKSPAASRLVDTLVEDRRTISNSLLLTGSILQALLLVLFLLALQLLAPNFFPFSWWAAAISLLGIIALFEILPKILSLHFPENFLSISAASANFLLRPVFPLVRRLQTLSDSFSKFYREEKTPEEILETSRMEFLSHLDLAGAEAVLRREEADLLREIVKLGDEAVTHCMTPRVDTFFLRDDLSQEDALNIMRNERFRILPVCGETQDDILGILDVQQALLNPEIPYLELLQPPAFIPDSMNALTLLQSFLGKNLRFAILLDEYGGIEGIVTLSDLLDEIAGDEGPDSESGLYLESLGPDRCLASGGVRLDDLVELLLWEDLETSAETLAGLISEIHGGIPRQGTTLHFQGWSLQIRRASRKRIKEVLLERPSTRGGQA